MILSEVGSGALPSLGGKTSFTPASWWCRFRDPEVDLEMKKKKSQAFIGQAFKLLLAINFPPKPDMFANNHSKAYHLGAG